MYILGNKIMANGSASAWRNGADCAAVHRPINGSIITQLPDLERMK